MQKVLFTLFSIFSLVFTAGAIPPVLPTPLQLSEAQGTYRLPRSLTIAVADSSLMDVRDYVADWMQIPVSYVTGAQGDIVLACGNVEGDSGTYRMEISVNGIKINGRDYAGVVNGLSTLRQLYTAPGFDGKLPLLTVEDAPGFQWRGLMLDCARHFFTVEEIERVLDMMALYKLNVFHWHLTDDQGWRAEIKKYPVLTEKGAWNKLNNLDRDCLSRVNWMDNKDFDLPSDRIRVVDGDTLYGGYYTQEQMRHIVDYAAKRAINVMPEIDVPGHSTMLTKIFPEMSCDGTPVYEICVGQEKTLPFIIDVYSELLDIFPFKYVFIGADEVDKSRWKDCPRCNALAERENLEGTQALQGWLTRELELFMRNHDRILTGWDEIINDGLGAETAIAWWRGDRHKVIERVTAEGKGAICSDCGILYLNGPNSNLTLRRILELDLRHDGLTSSQSRLVLGLQGQLWTEIVPSLRRIGYQIFPRLFAVAESGWTPLGKRLSYDDFFKAADREYRRLEAMGVNYALPDIEGVEEHNAFIDKAVLDPTCASKKATFRYTTDGTIPTAKSRLIKKPIEITDNAKFCVATFRDDGTRSDYKFVDFRKVTPMPAKQVEPAGEGLRLSWHRNDDVRSCRSIDSKPLIGELDASEIRLPEAITHDRAVIFRGYVYAGVTGIYDFALNSDDGSFLSVDGVMVVDNDGYHGTEYKQQQVALEKGWHEIEIRYFDFHDGSGYFEGFVTCKDKPDEPVRFAHL